MKRYIRNIPNASSSTEFDKLKEEMHANSLKRLNKKRAKYSKSKKKQAINRNRLRRLKEQQLDTYSKQLEDNLPKSEQWFRAKYLRESIYRKFQDSLHQDQFNTPFNLTYIPDISNCGYRYIIEVDGSFHALPEQQFKDIKKDFYFNKRGYIVIRVKDKDEDSYNSAIARIKARVKEIDGT